MDDADETLAVTSLPAGSPQDNVIGDGFEDGDEWDETLAQINLNLRPEDVPKPPTTSGHVYTFKNVSIAFPYRAYLSQRQMMEKIIEGVTTGENCLLESPTGTGKTAALLCSLLGWQKDCYNRNDNCSKIIQESAERMGGCTCGLVRDKEKTKVIIAKKKNELYLQATTTIDIEEVQNEEEAQPPTSDSEPSAKTTLKGIESPATSCSASPQKVSTSGAGTPPQKGSTSRSETPQKVKCHSPEPTDLAPSPSKRPKKQKVETEEKHIDKACDYCVRVNFIDKSRPPRIYYCTRTHSQITQVVKQLKATAYNHTKMTILASREPTCINERATTLLNPDLALVTPTQQEAAKKEPKISLNDYCGVLKKNFVKIERMKERLSPQIFEKLEKENKLPEVCEYFDKNKNLAHKFSNFQQRGAWDLEDIKREGMECKKCPFFGCNALQPSADIIFGSYNYLLQPDIRKGKEVKYINSVLVFDEAHNIEDICRNVFSFEIQVDSFDRNIRELVDSLLLKAQDNRTYVKSSTVRNLQNLSDTFKKWSDKIKEWGNKEVEIRGRANDRVKVHDISRPYENEELKQALIEMDMTANSVSNLLNSSGSEEDDNETTKSDTEDEEYYFDTRGNQKPFKLSAKVGEFLKNIRQTLKYLCGQEIDGVGGLKDFKGYLTGMANPSRKSSAQSDDSRRARALQQRQREPGPEFFFKFQIICLNPALGFRLLKNRAYSIIVASGTLTPLNSFASELATNFAVTLQADHVIPTSNVWAGVISKGPSNQDLALNRGRQDDIGVQDDLGKIIRDICYTVPNGVLVFFPSYTLMRKLEERWRRYPLGNSIFNQIQKKKMIFFEESKDKKAFKMNMERYKEFVKGGSTWDGCILFAVFRGKISEGIDFADEQARAVVTLGIPYSNAVAAEIVSKKAYNNMRKSTMREGETFLSGSEWYTTQAFRAMNQGFGRCVRHCADWGALILIDSRLKSKYHDSYISGWVRKNKKSYENFSDVKLNLAKFIQDMKTKMKAPRDHLQIAYEEEEDLNSTEVVAWPSESHEEMDSQEDEFLTQVASLHDNALHNMVTQRVPTSSTPIPGREITEVGESSPEYSFTEEVDEVLGSLPSPVAPVVETNSAEVLEEVDDDRRSNSSSVSVFERTPPGSGDDESDNDSDREMFDIADRLQSSVDDQSSQNETQQQQNDSDILDVSMPSASEGVSDFDMSQMSDISYHSELDNSVS